jgi:hypothetical protein
MFFNLRELCFWYFSQIAFDGALFRIDRKGKQNTYIFILKELVQSWKWKAENRLRYNIKMCLKEVYFTDTYFIELSETSDVIDIIV